MPEIYRLIYLFVLFLLIYSNITLIDLLKVCTDREKGKWYKCRRVYNVVLLCTRVTFTLSNITLSEQKFAFTEQQLPTLLNTFLLLCYSVLLLLCYTFWNFVEVMQLQTFQHIWSIKWKKQMACACAGSPVENLVKSVKQHLRNRSTTEQSRIAEQQKSIEERRGVVAEWRTLLLWQSYVT